jgi:hypothetical protein
MALAEETKQMSTPSVWTADPDKRFAAVKCGHQVEVSIS